LPDADSLISEALTGSAVPSARPTVQLVSAVKISGAGRSVAAWSPAGSTRRPVEPSTHVTSTTIGPVAALGVPSTCRLTRSSAARTGS
jgi:hypothetical protein